MSLLKTGTSSYFTSLYITNKFLRLLKKNTIPFNKQDTRAIGGVDIRHMPANDQSDYQNQDHRDDYFILGILTKGGGTLVCDMVNIELKAPALFIVKPFQVHSIKKYKNVEGYFFSIAPFVIPGHCHTVFESLRVIHQQVKISKEQKEQMVNTALLLHRAFTEINPYKTFIIKGLMDALIHRVISLFHSPSTDVAERKSQPEILTSSFKKLLTDRLFSETPSFFAKKLNVSTSHLNDCVKSVTGFPVTYWLQHTLLMEARRNLYYTNKSVKEIAYNLGFDDHTYFSRLFRKITGETPTAFRNTFRE